MREYRECISAAWLDNLCHKDLFLSSVGNLTADLTEEEGDILSSLSQTSSFSTPTHPRLFFHYIGPFYFYLSSLSGANAHLNRLALSGQFFFYSRLLSLEETKGGTEKNYLVCRFASRVTFFNA